MDFDLQNSRVSRRTVIAAGAVGLLALRGERARPRNHRFVQPSRGIEFGPAGASGVGNQQSSCRHWRISPRTTTNRR